MIAPYMSAAVTPMNITADRREHPADDLDDFSLELEDEERDDLPSGSITLLKLQSKKYFALEPALLEPP